MLPFRPLVQEIETPRLHMRPWLTSDSEAVRCLWAERDPRSLHVIDAAGRPTMDDVRLGIEKQLEASIQTGLALLAVETKSDGDFIGYVG
jgi:hypothetical protein